LAQAGWIAPPLAETLAFTARALHQIRLLLVLVPDDPLPAVDTTKSASICQEILGLPAAQQEN
jgi:hypothetical protein